MNYILSWTTPARVIPADEWQAISADGAPPGVYTPNMSREDMELWKARLIRPDGKSRRVEIRKSVRGVQMLLVVTGDSVTMSLNGKAALTAGEFDQMAMAVAEARQRLEHERMRAEDLS